MAENRPSHFYDQSAVVPFRIRDGEPEVLLISSRKKKHWVIPKGVKEPGISAQESAQKEALEEAGVEGSVLPEPIGDYEYRKWGGVCRVEVFLMKVQKIHEQWLESYRDREWLTPDDASKRVKASELGRILASVPRLISNGS